MFTFEESISSWCGVDLLLDLSAGQDTVDDDEETRHHGGDQGTHGDGPEVLGCAHPGERGEGGGHDDHPGAEVQVEARPRHQGPGQLRDEHDEHAAAPVQGEGDGDHGHDAAPPPHSLLPDGGVGVPDLAPELLVPLLQHDPAEAEPGAREPGVYCEHEDEDQAEPACKQKVQKVEENIIACYCFCHPN